ncbi:unnamed protein product, partial [Polarella glacialis]
VPARLQGLGGRRRRQLRCSCAGSQTRGRRLVLRRPGAGRRGSGGEAPEGPSSRCRRGQEVVAGRDAAVEHPPALPLVGGLGHRRVAGHRENQSHAETLGGDPEASAAGPGRGDRSCALGSLASARSAALARVLRGRRRKGGGQGSAGAAASRSWGGVA